MSIDPLLRFLHIASVTLWVGGMFFAYICLRPVAASLLEPAIRLQLWRQVFARFFPWVGGIAVIIPVSGFIMISQVGFAAAPRNWHAMMLSGLVMVGIFIYVYIRPYRLLCQAVADQVWPLAGSALNRIRQLVGINLALGVFTIGIATLGRWFS
ncbi:CopD family protein [Chitinimonas naiadis]